MNLVLDADGVLLDYNKRMAEVYAQALNLPPLQIKKHSYHFHNMYEVSPTPEEQKKVFDLFDTQGWEFIPAIEGSIEASQNLHQLGHTLTVLSSMPEQFVQARTSNLHNLGFPVSQVIGSGRSKDNYNPKAIHLEQLLPDIFVDDQLRNFAHIPESITKVWINNQYPDSPDIGFDESIADFTYSSLFDFSQDFSLNPDKFKKIIHKKPHLF